MDYCFIKHAGDDRWLTVLVGRLYPSCALFSTPCTQKGADAHATACLASFFRSCGVNNMTCMSDQELALKTMIVDALEVCKGRGEWIGAVPGNSPVGESASNGRAERAVQRFEDQIRTFLAELEHRIGTSLTPSSPILAWLVEYVTVVLNKYHVNEATGVTAYEYLHGKAADEERLAYFGERVFFSIPKRCRSNLDLRWSIGVFLGTMMHSNEAWIGLPNGDVTRTASVARLIPSQKWNAQSVLGVTGTPARPTRSGYDDSVIESYSNPHLMLDAEQKAIVDRDDPDDMDLPVMPTS